MARNYSSMTPQIAKAFQNDPRTMLAQSQLAAGTSTAPVAQGGWGVTDGLARAAQAILGAVQQKNLAKEYGAREAKFGQDMAGAITPGAGTPPIAPPAQPAQAPEPAPAMQSAALALGGPQRPASGPMGGMMQPPQAQMPPTPMQPVDPDAAMAPRPGQAPAPGQRATPFTDGGANGPVPFEAFKAAIIGQETGGRYGIKNAEGSGAVGIGQVMPATGRALARRAGLRWRADLMSGTSPEARQYQDTITDMALKEAYAAGGNGTDIATASKYYFAGSNRKGWGRKTERYASDIARRLGQAAPATVGGDTGQPFSYANIAPPEMEEVPDAPVTNMERPQMPEVSPQVQSERLAIAKRMLASGNPDLIGMAQEYMDKGLSEDFDAAQARNQQVYGRENLGYQSDLSDVNSARSDYRQNGYASRREALEANRRRESEYRGQTFQAGQQATQNQFAAGEAEKQRAFTGEQNALERAERKQQFDTEMGFKIAKLKQDAPGAGGKNVFLTTPTGLKMQGEMEANIAKYDEGIGQFERALGLLENVNTGGVDGLVNGTLAPMFSANASELQSIMNKSTLSELGGSLGTAISDGDRKFIAQSNMSFSNNRKGNRDIARAAIAGLRRKKDYELARLYSKSAGENPGDFQRTWQAFASSVPIVKDGKVVSDTPVSFDQWRASIKKYDANGNPVQ